MSEVVEQSGGFRDRVCTQGDAPTRDGVCRAHDRIALVGPTASGKSAVAMELSRRMIRSGRRVEIVSCDSMQVYRGMDIGTAKATPAERAEVPHHMLDLVDPSEDHDLARFLVEARSVLSGIAARGATALLVGGTGLYVRALVDGFNPPPHFADVVKDLESIGGTDILAARLAELDPVALSRIPEGNRRRIIRALEVTIGTGVPFSQQVASFQDYRSTPFAMFGLGPDRVCLTKVIRDRLDAQMDEGFLDEVASLSGRGGGLSPTAAQALGYRELLGHLAGETSLAEAVEKAKVRTRRFAVRQLRWFSRDPRIAWLSPPGSDRTPLEVAADLERAVGYIDRTAGSEPATVTDDPAVAPEPAVADHREPVRPDTGLREE